MLWSKAIRAFLVLAMLALVIPISLAYADHGLSGDVTVRDSVASPGLSEANLGDSVVVHLTGLEEPAAGKVYNGWLVSDDGSRTLNLGVIDLDANGEAHQTFVTSAPSGENLISVFDTFKATVESKGRTASSPSSDVLLQHTVPAKAIDQIRYLLYSSTGNPEYTGGTYSGTAKGVLVGLRQQSSDAVTNANSGLTSIVDGDLAGAKTQARRVINIIEGSGGTNYSADAGYNGDGFGILNYAADASHATKAADAAPDDISVGTYAPQVTDSAANVTTWAASARDNAVRATNTSSTLVAKLYLSNVVRILTRSLNGYDADRDGVIEAIVGEGGAEQAYVAAQNMAAFDPTTPPEEAAPPKVGDSYVPLVPLYALVLGAILVLGGTYTYRRSRIRA